MEQNRPLWMSDSLVSGIPEKKLKFLQTLNEKVKKNSCLS